MFGWFEDAVDNILDVADTVTDFELPSKRQVAKLVDTGLTVASIAAMYDVGTDVIEGLLEDD